MLGASLATPVFGSVVAVDFGGTDMVARNRNLSLGQQYENPEGVFSRIRIGQYPLNPESTLYNGIPFYGLIQQVGEPTSNTLQARVADGIDGDYLQVRTYLPKEVELNTVFFFKKEDFRNGVAEIGKLSLANLEAMTASIPLLAGSGDNPKQSARFLVQSGGQWYISEESIDDNGDLSLSNPAASRWARYSLPRQTGGKVEDVPEKFDVSGGSLTDVQAVGLWSYIFGTSPSNASAEIRLKEFRTIWIPEPGIGTIAVSAVAAVALLVHLRRRRG